MDRCCRATCARIADGMGLRRHIVTHACYRDLSGGRVPADSMVAEALEVCFGGKSPCVMPASSSQFTFCKPAMPCPARPQGRVRA